MMNQIVTPMMNQAVTLMMNKFRKKVNLIMTNKSLKNVSTQ